jgi:group I intron endonuclease
MGYIYRLKNKINGKIYIGQTTRSIHKRLREHQKESSGCVAIHSAIKFHGWENFEKEWYEVPDDDLNFYEEMLIALLGTLAPDGYNLMEGGGSNGKPSEESRQKMREAKLGKIPTDETKQKMSESRTGEKHYKYGKTENEETKQKRREAQLGEKHPSSKRVYQYDLDGKYIQSFGSAEEAARHLNKTDGSSISACARGAKNGRHKTAHNFKWSHVEM